MFRLEGTDFPKSTVEDMGAGSSCAGPESRSRSRSAQWRSDRMGLQTPTGASRLRDTNMAEVAGGDHGNLKDSASMRSMNSTTFGKRDGKLAGLGCIMDVGSPERGRGGWMVRRGLVQNHGPPLDQPAENRYRVVPGCLPSWHSPPSNRDSFHSFFFPPPVQRDHFRRRH